MNSQAQRVCVGLFVLTSWIVSLSAQVTTGVVAGTVKDDQGAVIPGASATLTSETRGTRVADVVTNDAGDFVFPNVPGDTYTLQITLEGFRTTRRIGIAVSPGDRVVVPALTLEIGTLDEAVEVRAESPVIQAHTGERSFTVTTDVVQNLPVANRNFAALTALTPGVIGTTRLGGGGQNNFMIDGVSTMDTGNNGQLLQLNVEAIAEVKVLTQSYQAEYGRSSGLQISAVTKSGTNQFRGAVYDIERNSDWSANSWASKENGDPKPVSKNRDWGYSLGGPVGTPGGVNRLFFFYSHEYRPRSAGGNISRFRVPTLLERQGDFSETRDNTGNVFNRLRDYTTGLPCTAANTSGCFQDGGVLGRIPQSRLYPIGMNILNNLWPLPNVSQGPGQSYNFETTTPVTDSLTHQPAVRMDYQPAPRLRLTGKYAGQLQPRFSNPGPMPGFTDETNWYPNRHTISTTVNLNLGAATFLEGSWGFGQNRLGLLVTQPVSNRANAGLADFPMLYPDAGLIDPKYYYGQVLAAARVPWFVDGRMLLPPIFAWGNRIGSAPPSLGTPNTNINRSRDAHVSVTHLRGRHTLKAGLYWNYARKAQYYGAGRAQPWVGLLSFANDANNPLDTGFGFANAALGVFTQYEQQSKFVEGNFVYNNIEWYLQDNWRATSRLTFDYGLAPPIRPTPSAVRLDQLELETAYRLYRARIWLGRSAHVARTAQGLLVSARVPTEHARSTLGGLFSDLTNTSEVALDIEVAPTPVGSGAWPDAGPADRIPLYPLLALTVDPALPDGLRNYHMQAFVSGVRKALEERRERLDALHTLLIRWPEERLQVIEPAAAVTWQLMVQEHADAVRRDTVSLRRQLERILDSVESHQSPDALFETALAGANASETAARLMTLATYQDDTLRVALVPCGIPHCPMPDLSGLRASFAIVEDAIEQLARFYMRLGPPIGS